MGNGRNGADLVGRVAVYTRVSTEEQASKPESSLDNQLHRCRQYLASMGYAPGVVDSVRVYREEGFSGKDTNRPELQRLLRDIRNGRVGMLVFTELSRVSRSVSDFLSLAKFLDASGVQFISLREHFDTSTPQGNLILVILVALYQFERETTSIRTKLAMRDRAERGLFSGGTIPIGYRSDSDHSGRLHVVEKEAHVVREAFRIYCETGSLAITVKKLKEAGLGRPEWVSRRGTHHKAASISWSALQAMLRNPTYLGLKELNRETRNLSEEEMLALPENERYRLVDAAWEAIVDEDLFAKANALLDVNAGRLGNALAPKHHEYVLVGIIRCGTCGAPLEGASAVRKGTQTRYYYYRHPAGTPTERCRRAIRAEIIEPAVFARLSMLADNDKMLAAIVDRANQQMDDDGPERERDLNTARARVSKLETQQSTFLAHLMSAPPGAVPDSYWATAKQLDADLVAARAHVQRLEIEVADMKAARLRVDGYRAALREFGAVVGRLDPLQRQAVLSYLIDEITITEDEWSMALVGQEPVPGTISSLVDVPAAFAPTPEWLPLCDLNTRPTD